MERVAQSEHGVRLHALGDQVDGGSRPQADAADQQPRRGILRIPHQALRGGAQRALQQVRRVGTLLALLGEGEVEANAQVAALGQLAVQCGQDTLLHVAARVVGEHDADARPGWPPLRNSDDARDDDLGRDGNLDLLELRGRAHSGLLIS
jgi:hypothetical protein